MKICPTDWLEGIAMAATGGIYCQFKQAEYILEDFKAEVQRIHTTGEAERDALEAQYLAECARQSAEATDAIAKKQQALQELLDMAALCVRRAAGLSFTAERAATVRHGAGLPPARDPLPRWPTHSSLPRTKWPQVECCRHSG